MSGLCDLSVALRPSRWMLAAGATLHLLAGFAVLSSSVPTGVKTAFMAALGLSLSGLGFRHGMARGSGFIAGVERLDGRWRLQAGDGGAQPARLTGGYACPSIIILNFRLDDGRCRSLTLLPDSADAESLRRLRVLLRVGRDEASHGDGLG